MDIYEYFERLKDKRYAVFMATSDDASTGLNDKISELFSYLGLEGTVQEHFHSSYYAIISDQELIEEVDEGKVFFEMEEAHMKFPVAEMPVIR